MNNISPHLVLIRECIIGYKNLEKKFDKLFKTLEKKLDKVHSNQKRLHSKVDTIVKHIVNNKDMNDTIVDINSGSTTQALFQEMRRLIFFFQKKCLTSLLRIVHF